MQTILPGFFATLPGLQRLIDQCSHYASRWKFKFRLPKTNCMIVGKNHIVGIPELYLQETPISIVPSLEILGVTFKIQALPTSNLHCERGMEKCCRSFFALAYPGGHSNVKAYLWKTSCQPVLLYGIAVTKADERRMDTLQGIC